MSLLHVARHRPPPALADTFLMARRHSVFPILNTAETGTWSWVGDAGKMFAGVYTNVSNALGDSFSLDNLNLFNAGVALNLLHTKASNGCTVSVYWGTKDEPTDLLGTFSTWAATTQKNVVEQIDLGTVPKGRETLHFVVSAAGAGGGHTMQIQQAEVVQLTGDNTGSSIDDLPWWVDVPPFASSASTGGSPTLAQATTAPFGSYVFQSGVHSVDYDVGLFHGTWKIVDKYTRNADRGEATYKLNGSTVGTLDHNGSLLWHATGEITGIAVTSAGAQVFRQEADGLISREWLQWRKTAAHGAITPTGATYGRETMELWPWFWDSNTNFDTIALSNNSLYYGYAQTDGNQFDSGASEINPLSGAYLVDLVAHLGSNRGVVHLSLDGGADIDTVDTRNGGTSWNQSKSMSGHLSPGSLEFSMDSTFGSAYYLTVSQIRLTRTGA